MLETEMIDPSQDWRTYAPDEVKNDPDLSRVIQNAQEKDLGSVIKSFAHYERGKGSSLRLPSPDKPEELKAFKGKLAEKGFIKLPPEKYEITRPESVPAEAWSDDLVGEFTDIAGRHGFSAEAVKDLLDFETKRFNGAAGQAKAALEFDYEQTKQDVTAKAKEIGMSYEEAMEWGGRWLEKNLKEKDIALLKETGMANHPGLVWIITRAGLEAGEDISALVGAEGAPKPPEQKEIDDIMYNKDNPKHELWKKGDPATRKYVDDLWAKTTGGK